MRLWYSPDGVVYEGEQTGDGRLITKDALRWEPLPNGWPLRVQWTDNGGHDGAALVGAGTDVAFEDGAWKPDGWIDDSDPDGAELVRRLEHDPPYPLGVSIDMDDMTIQLRARDTSDSDGDGVVLLAAAFPSGQVTFTGDRWTLRVHDAAEALTAAGLHAIVAAAGDGETDGDVIFTEAVDDLLVEVLDARVRGLTVVQIPAFARAALALRPADAEPGDGAGEPAVAAAVTGASDLPVADRDHPWDGDEARRRVFDLCTGDDGEADPSCVSRAFLWRDDAADPATMGAYRLGFADVIDGRLRIVPRGVFAAAGGRGVDALEGVPEEDLERIRSRICTLYERLADHFEDPEIVCPFDDEDGMTGSSHPGSGGAMIALIPEDPAALAVPGGDPADELHVTLAYLGQAGDLTDEAVQAARETVEETAGGFPGIEARVAGIGTLGDEDPPATVLLLNGAEMDEFRQAVWRGLGDYGWEAYHDQHQPWLPHLTVGYGTDPDEVTVPATIRFDRVRLAVGEDVEDLALAASDGAAVASSGCGCERSCSGCVPAREPARVASSSSAAPMAPPKAWFNDPDFGPDDVVTVEDPNTGRTLAGVPMHYEDGRAFGHIALWGQCHTGSPDGECVMTPRSPSGYRWFHHGHVVTAEGDRLPVGSLTLGGGHADIRLSYRAALDHYDDVTTLAAQIRVGEDQYGIWAAGAVMPDVWEDELAMRKLRAASPSGDWRWVGGAHELSIAHCVNGPGFPVPRAQVASGGTIMTLVAAGAREVALLAGGTNDSGGPVALDPAALRDLMQEAVTAGISGYLSQAQEQQLAASADAARASLRARGRDRAVQRLLS